MCPNKSGMHSEGPLTVFEAGLVRLPGAACSHSLYAGQFMHIQPFEKLPRQVFVGATHASPSSRRVSRRADL